MWSPGGQLPYEYIERKKKGGGATWAWHVDSLRSPPPPTVLLNQLETRAVQGSERLLGLAFLWIRARLLRRGLKRFGVPHPYPLPSLWRSSPG